MSAVTPSRDALAKTLLPVLMDEYGGDPEDWTGMRSLRRVTDALIAAGAVVPLDTLAGDEALIEAMRANLHYYPPGRGSLRAYVRALVAALSERGDYDDFDAFLDESLQDPEFAAAFEDAEQRSKDQAAADRERIEALRERWETALGEGRCPSCHMPPGHDCDHGEGYHHALSDLRAALDSEGGA
jgi:hypothetical protein